MKNPKPFYKLRYEITDEFKDATTIKISPNGKYFAVVVNSNIIKIFDLLNGTLKHIFTNYGASDPRGSVLNQSGISDLCWSYNSEYLASACDNHTISIWSMNYTTTKTNSNPTRILFGHTYCVTCVQFTPKGNLLISGGADEAIRIWDVLRGKTLKTLSAHSDPISSIDVTYDGTMLASGSYDGLIRLFDIASGQCLKTLMSSSGDCPICYVKFSPNGKFLLSNSLDGQVRLWDYISNKVVKTYKGSPNVALKYSIGVDFIIMKNSDESSENYNSQLVISGSENGKIFLWDLNDKQLVDELPGSDCGAPVFQIDVYKQGEIVASVSRAGEIKIWEKAQ